MNLSLKPIYLVLFVVFCVYVFVAALPQNNMAFDECYYRPSSVDALRGVASNLEHPPLVKLIAGLSIGLLGDSWVAWRLPIILFSMLAVAMTYLIARRFLSERQSVFASVLLCLSLIFMLLGSTLVLDMPFIAFGLAGIYFALYNRFGLSGLMFGLSFLCKELAVLIFLPTLIYFLVKKTSGWKMLWFCAVGFIVAFFGMWLFDLVYHPVIDGVWLSNPVHNFLIWIQYQFNLNGMRNLPDGSWAAWYPPVSWVSPFGENAFNPLKLIWLEVGGREFYAFLLQPNVAVEYLMFPLLVLLPVAYWVKRNGVALLCWLGLSLTFLPWLAAGFFVRTQANFYVGYSVPFLAVGCAYLYGFIHSRRLRYGLAFAQVAVGLVWFLYYFPLPLFR